MELLIETSVTCPYCGETFSISVDTSQPEQESIEECAVCCRPVSLRISSIPGELLQLSARREDEA